MEGRIFQAEKPKWKGLDRRLWLTLEQGWSKVWNEDEEVDRKQFIKSFFYVTPKSLDFTLKKLKEPLKGHKEVNNQSDFCFMKLFWK